MACSGTEAKLMIYVFSSRVLVPWLEAKAELLHQGKSSLLVASLNDQWSKVELRLRMIGSTRDVIHTC
jgi:hypothetical protein